MGGIEAALAEHAFEHLFIECLGWDRAQVSEQIHLPEIECDLTGIAHKRGFTVFLAQTHRTILANRALLRTIQRRLRKSHHEHILIHYCETPRKQVWQWSTTPEDGGRRLLHREHPFFSNSPPERLLRRLEDLEISLSDEESTTLPDILNRVRAALQPDQDRNLFAKRPAYAAKSDRLAMAMKHNEPGAFSAFIKLHTPLARKASKMLIRWFQMEPEDAEQIAMIGLMEAARRFDPERGYQFATYASYWLRQICQRYGLEGSLAIRIPPHIFWPCFRLQFRRAELLAKYGKRAMKPHFERALAEEGVRPAQWKYFLKARSVTLHSELPRPQSWELRNDNGVPVDEQVAQKDIVANIRKGIAQLPPREAEVLRFRYGIETPEQTLQEVGERFGVSRERIRQIQVRAEGKLEQFLRACGLGEEKPDCQVEIDNSHTPEVTA